MKTVRQKIHLLIYFSLLLVTIIITHLILNRTIETYNEEAKEMLLAEVINESNYFNDQLLDVEKTATAIEVLVEALFDVERFTDDDYFTTFKSTLAPAIKKITVETSRSKSGYMYFYHELTDSTHDVWYADIHGQGQVVRQPEIQAEYYEAYDPDKDWYFNPINQLKPFWSNPFDGTLDFTQDIVFVSFTKPVIKDGLLIGVAGSDYLFNNMIDYIGTITPQNNGYALLLDGNYDVIVNQNHIPSEINEFWTIQKLKHRQDGVVDLNEDQLLVFNTLRNGWTFAFVIEKYDLNYWYHEVENIVVILILSALFFGFIYARGISSHFASPMDQLIDSINSITEGHYHIAIDQNVLNKKDEVGLLAKRVDHLRDKLLNVFETIHDQNIKLSDTVNKRTQSLNESHIILKQSLEENKIKNDELKALNESLEFAIENMSHTQQLLIEKEKAASISVIVAKMAHEFNTPIGSFLTLFTYLNKKRINLEEDLKNKALKKEDLEAFLKHYDNSQVMILDALEAIRTLVERFKGLDHYSKSNVKSNINIRDFIALIVEESSTNHKLKVTIDCQMDLNVTIDAGKFSQIILHVIENAFLHGYDGESGLVEIIVSYDQSLKLSIIDYGRGIPKQLINEIFVPFYSEFLSSRHSGLGLNIVYNLVTQAFNGQINCTSKVNEFTRFDIKLEI